MIGGAERLAEIEINLRAVGRLELAGVHHEVVERRVGLHRCLFESSGVLKLALRHLNRCSKLGGIGQGILAFVEDVL